MHNVLVHCVDVSAPNNPSFLTKNHTDFVPAITVKCTLFRNHKEIKVVGGTCNVLVHYVGACVPDPAGV